MRHLIAATATVRQMPWGWALAVLTIAAVGYALSCWWWPFAKCWCCGGRGVHARRDGEVWRTCRVCRGSKRRLRIGRKTWNYFAATRRNSL